MLKFWSHYLFIYFSIIRQHFSLLKDIPWRNQNQCQLAVYKMYHKEVTSKQYKWNSVKRDLSYLCGICQSFSVFCLQDMWMIFSHIFYVMPVKSFLILVVWKTWRRLVIYGYQPTGEYNIILIHLLNNYVKMSSHN